LVAGEEIPCSVVVDVEAAYLDRASARDEKAREHYEAE